MTKLSFALLALCFCTAVLLTGCFKPEPVATLPQAFAPLWDEADEPISGLWRRADLHGKVKVVGFVPYKGKVDLHGRVQKLKGPVVIANRPGYVSSEPLLAYPLATV